MAEPFGGEETSTAMSRELSRDESIWQRGFFMLFFLVIYAAAEAVVFLVAVIQFGCVVLRDERNPRLTALGESLSRFVYEIVRFWTFASEKKPFPFSDWPSPDERQQGVEGERGASG